MVAYKTGLIRTADLKQIIQESGLQRRTDDEHRLTGMIENADVLISAWDDKRPVGFVRALTDYADVIYVADLAVVKDYERQGIGRHLVDLVIQAVGADKNVVLVASPGAADYYSHLGFTRNDRGYVRLGEQS
ncbi:GNAT family N-acetyltransferase [Lacticaseibacillus thailandensis]|uniref:N-acetyltransferase domain-containing protein n=1 Tax=Lacticaseibacillus thailandensis DSM 22698 = JCM 13996 TaxID=1423810 RepID=A0A0R2CB56_9LACO|nr:GNAT family N-acetyltransferase [Lacticaseibacillus thailandensis]KRM87252.1 hypothetical protein FD19_GL001410 [Lacticaseibacillus thailandensis DSM 22698 = JCM 13996]